MDTKIIFLMLFTVKLTSTNFAQDITQIFNPANSKILIVGGHKTVCENVPYVAILTRGLTLRGLVCGASVITTRTVLTAAHCVSALYFKGSLSRSLRITVGTDRLDNRGQTYRVLRNITHPKYNPNTIVNDLGLLITRVEILITKYVRPVPINSEFIPGGVDAKVAGFGRIKAGQAISVDLLELDVKTLDGNKCGQEVKKMSNKFSLDAPAIENRLQICTYHSVGHGVCNGDSGGALVEKSSGTQIGIVSWGFPCAVGAPDIFTRLSAFGPWLEEYVV